MIYIAAQKAFTPPRPEGYRPIHVGAARKKSIGLYRDDTGDHISKKYRNYRELTGLYWVWKNSRAECKGFMPQGRYFGLKHLSKSARDVYSHEQLRTLLLDADILLPRQEILPCSVEADLLACCNEDVLEKLRFAVEKAHPEYLSSYDTVFAGNRYCAGHLFFCQAKVFDSYCQWLFDILSALEGIVNLRALNRRQQPIFAVLAERLLNVWAMHQGLKCHYLPVVVSGISLKEKLTLSRRRFTNRITYALRRRSS